MTRLESAIGLVLLHEWDPHNAVRLPESGAYDGYASSLATILQRGTTEDEIVEWLYAREQESVCFPSLGTQRLRRVARKLLAIPTSQV